MVDPKNFSKQQRKALWRGAKKYLKNWEAAQVEDLDEIEIQTASCPCCEKWRNLPWLGGKEGIPECHGCPIAEFTGKPLCEGTPWKSVDVLYGEIEQHELHELFGDFGEEDMSIEDCEAMDELWGALSEALEEEYRFLVTLALGEKYE